LNDEKPIVSKQFVIFKVTMSFIQEKTLKTYRTTIRHR